MRPAGGYLGKFLRVDLSGPRIQEEELGDQLIEKYVGGTGIGARILYDEVPPGVEWNDPKNRIIFFSGPLGRHADLRNGDLFRGHQRPHDQPGRVLPGERPVSGPT